MRNLLAGLFAATLLFAAPVQAGDQPVVVELFTSQGCSSCPPADALLTEIARRDNVIALALHVNYWDYLGWPDTVASKEFTLRQRAYARARHQRTIYTPQIIVGGMEHIVGVKPGVLEKAIRMEAAAPDLVSLSLRPAGDKVEISARALGPIPDGTIVQLVRVRPSQTVDIGRGENAGRTFTYSHIVTDWTRIGLWNGEAPFTRKISAPGKDETVVIVQEPGPGRILAAAVLR